MYVLAEAERSYFFFDNLSLKTIFHFPSFLKQRETHSSCKCTRSHGDGNVSCSQVECEEMVDPNLGNGLVLSIFFRSVWSPVA